MATPQNPGEEGRVKEQDPNRRGAFDGFVDSSWFWLCGKHDVFYGLGEGSGGDSDDDADEADDDDDDDDAVVC